MGLETLEVVLEPHQPVYFPGQTLRGFVRVVASTAVSCREIVVNPKGKAFVGWVEKKGKATQSFTAIEEYFNKLDSVWQGVDVNNTLGPGEHTFPFTYELPFTLPSSMEGRFGRVRYRVKGMMRQPRSVKKSTKVMFYVTNTLDLNREPLARFPQHTDEDKTVCFPCFAQDPIHLEMEIQQTGYVLGENIVLNGEVVNNSRSTIKYSEAKIIQVVQHFARDNVKEHWQTVQRVYRARIKGGERQEWDGVTLAVPSVPPSHLNFCHIMNIEYFLVFCVKLGVCQSAQIKMPIIIGSVPLQETFPAAASWVDWDVRFPPRLSPLSAMSLPREVYGAAPPSYLNTVISDEYRDGSLPSYASCISSAQDDPSTADSPGGDQLALQYTTTNTRC